MKKFYAFCLITVTFLFTYGQISQGGTPKSLLFQVSDVEDEVIVSTASISWQNVKREDSLRDLQNLPKRGGFSLPVNKNIWHDGTWERLPDGTMMWRIKLRAPGALSVGVVFDQFELPEDAELYIYNENKSIILGAYTAENNTPSGIFSVQTIPGEVLIIEYLEKPHQGQFQPVISNPGKNGSITIYNLQGILQTFEPRGKLSIGDIIYVYFDLLNDPTKDLGDAGSCQVNINCSPEGDNWQVQKRGVARIFFKDGANWYYCSGSLVNNTLNNGQPYFLTAYHCGGSASPSDKNQWQFYFNYERPGCPNTGTPPNNVITGCTHRAGGDINGGSDFLLVELSSQPPLSWNPYYNGWDRNTTATAGGVGIHHPAGDAKKISTYTVTPGTGTWTGGMANAHWTISSWASTSNGYGVTEGGSSGSPLFRGSNKLIIGTLTGGASQCGGPYGTDYYGKFNYHWDQNGTTPDKQLKPWLDPNNSNPTTLNGFDPNANTNPPVANFSGTPTSGQAGTAIQFTDLSTNYPTSWKWSFPGAIPSTSTLRNPQVIYPSPGTYSVKLVVSNAYGKDSITKVNYITISSYTPPSSPVTIGTGTTSGGLIPLGINNTTKYVCDAAIYTKTEIGGSGIITAIAWRPSAARTDTRNIQIYLKTTDQSTLSQTTFNNLIQDATLVYSGTFVPNINGWYTITLQTPFPYVANKNLMVLTKVWTTGNPGNVPSNCYYTTATNMHQQWTGGTDPSGNNGTVNSNRPNIRLTISPFQAPTANFAGLENIFVENFEGSWPPTGWVIHDKDNDGIKWTSSTAQNHTENGLKSALHDYGSATVNEIGWLVSPGINLPAGYNYKLSFWSYNQYPTYYGKNRVLISTTSQDTSTFTEIWSPTSVTDSWVQTIIDLSSYAGQTVYVAFKYTGVDAHRWFLDDVTISREVTTQLVTYEGEPVTILDKSTNTPVWWEWTLPGSVDQNLYTQNAFTKYNVAGEYNVILTAANPAGSNTKTVNNFVKVLGRAPIANFEGTGNLKDWNLRPFIPQGGYVNYKDKSLRVPTGWNWTFQGGVPSTSQQQNPSVQYLSQGKYATTLHAYNPHGNDAITYLNYVVVGGRDTCTNLLISDNVTVYNLTAGLLPGHGYITSSGTNYFFYKYAEKFNNQYSGKIYGFGFYAYRAQGTGKTINVSVWTDNGGVPGTRIYTETRNITSFTQGQYNWVIFSSPVNVSGPFYIGYELNYDSPHNYTTHQFCAAMSTLRNNTDNSTMYTSFGTASPGTWYDMASLFGQSASLWLDLIFEYNTPTTPLAAVEAIPGCGTGSVKVVSSQKTTQTFHLTDNAGNTLQTWTGNDSVYTFTGLSNGTYRGKVVIGGTSSPLSNPVNLTSPASTNPGTLNGTLTEICIGNNIGTLTLSGYVGNILQWEKRVNNGSWTTISNQTATYSETPSSSGIWDYRVLVKNATCPSQYSNIYSVTVHPTTIAGTLSAPNSQICQGSNTGTMTLTGYTGSIVKWQRSNNGGATWTDINNTTNTYSEVLATPGTYLY
ncbi:MAG: choice-of-anchor J domain-containing protein, partial [Bacteroidales bacterium]|nr:choice-of-anchor J domain-containing protein [Bacteroidales bacterium]